MEAKIDFRQVKQQVSLVRVLLHYKIQIRRTNGDQLVADCPLPTHTSKESHHTLKLNALKGVWCCLSESCVAGYKDKLGGKSGGDVLDFVSLKEGISILQAAKLCLDWFPEDGNALQSPDGSGEVIEPSPSSLREAAASAPEQNKPLPFGGLKGIQYCDYLEKRSITRETAAMLSLLPYQADLEGRSTGRVFPINLRAYHRVLDRVDHRLCLYCDVAVGHLTESDFKRAHRFVFRFRPLLRTLRHGAGPAGSRWTVSFDGCE
jgi:hypothetical protein